MICVICKGGSKSNYITDQWCRQCLFDIVDIMGDIKTTRSEAIGIVAKRYTDADAIIEKLKKENIELKLQVEALKN